MADPKGKTCAVCYQFTFYRDSTDLSLIEEEKNSFPSVLFKCLALIHVTKRHVHKRKTSLLICIFTFTWETVQEKNNLGFCSIFNKEKRQDLESLETELSGDKYMGD